MPECRVSRTARPVACQHCRDRLARGDLRLDLLRPGGTVKAVYHAGCAFSPTVQLNIQDPTILAGWADLPDDDRQLVRTLVQRKLDVHQQQQQPNQSRKPENEDDKSHPRPRAAPVLAQNSTSAPELSATGPSTSNPAVVDAPILISDDEEEEPAAQPAPVGAPRPRALPDLLAGVEIPEGPERTGEECSVCLDPPVHPVSLPCSHVFCFLCAKGLVRGGGSCSLCRADIPQDWLERGAVLAGAGADLASPARSSGAMTWFYQGGGGRWWQYEERQAGELEEKYATGATSLETLIAGKLYVISLSTMEQYQKDFPNRKRRIKRDRGDSDCRGVAGLAKRKRGEDEV